MERELGEVANEKRSSLGKLTGKDKVQRQQYFKLGLRQFHFGIRKVLATLRENWGWQVEVIEVDETDGGTKDAVKDNK